MSTSAATHWSAVDGLRMHALHWQAAASAYVPPIVLVHGLGVSSRYMIPTGECLAGRHDVWAPDLPGFGYSEKPPHVYSLIEHARALEHWLAAARIDRPLLVGHSYGCQVIVELLATRPRLARGVVLGAPTVEAGRRSAPREFVRLIRDIPRERPALVPVVFGDYLRAGLVRIYRTLRGAIADRIEDKVGTIGVPTLLVRGEHDPLVSTAWIAALATRMPHARTLMIAGGGHAVNFSNADRFAEAVAEMATVVALRA